ncbi:MAG: glycosyltransferase family 9 protein [Thermomicrobiales bacterium]|nr:glycosyltransferase family 9 protein [Thermomicrobiales bacterium]
MALPTLDSLQLAFPDAERTVLVGEHSRAIFETRSSGWRIAPISNQITPRVAFETAIAVRRSGAGCVVVLERSRLLRWAFAAIFGERAHAVAPIQPEIRHESAAYLDVVRALGIVPSVSQPSMAATIADLAQADELLKPYDRPVVLHPGGAENPGTAMPDKRWPAERYAALARMLTEDGCDVLFSGGPGDRQLNEHVAVAAGLPVQRSLAGQFGLTTAAAVVSRAALFVSGDTGMSHIAAASGTPTVAIFGPTNPRRYRPIGRAVEVIAPEESWDLPDVDLRTASRDALPQTTSISVHEVYAAMKSTMANAGVAA